MAPGDDRKPKAPSDQPTDNPLVAFRRFADQQFAALFNGIAELSSAVAGAALEQQRRPPPSPVDQHSDEETECILRTYLRQARDIENRQRGGHGRWHVGYKSIEDFDNALHGAWRTLNLESDPEMRKDREQHNGSRQEAGYPPMHEWSGIYGLHHRSREDKKELLGEAERRLGLWIARRTQLLDDWDALSEEERSEARRTESTSPGQNVGTGSRTFPSQPPPGAASSAPEGGALDGNDASPNHDWVDEMLSSNLQHVASMQLCHGFVWPLLLGRGPYSLRTLESDASIASAGVAWRDAFDDLVRTTEARPMLLPGQLGLSIHMPYDAWALCIMQRDAIPPRNLQSFRLSHMFPPLPLVPPLRGLEARDEQWSHGIDDHDWSRFDDESSHENDHDHEAQHSEPPASMLAYISRRFSTHSPPLELPANDPEHDSSSDSSPGTPSADSPSSVVVSTMTTTQRTVQPDGTVTTTKVLKKRFADGREESSETVQTQHGHGEEECHHPASDLSPQELWKAGVREAQAKAEAHARDMRREDTAKQVGKEAKKTGGWFWS